MEKKGEQKVKRPDLVVFDEDKQRYDAAFRPYATNVGAPQIKLPNNGSWKNSQIYKANKHLKAKYEALKAEYDALLKILEYNELVTASKFTFEPLIGEVYHLYNNTKEQPFLSIIEPDSCDFQHLGSFRLTSDYLWEIVEEKSNKDLVKV
ncbi:MAG: DUF2452 domain-containing protein [Winogradskyella sp.]|uniref:DUF2452 domain-containing protein n=1 Tax=Winogradskyella sp. TaxID=1883156 RepID=UPI0025CCDB92|nr:DUF2452 domain-containing protein [Winogradskyella sp.]NRB82896.1 DUF2452 domain-containing protein [Winogradskyella sp.]